MSHSINYRSFHCSTTPKQILKNLNSWAYDPQESCGYHGHLTFHPDIVCKNEEEAYLKLQDLVRESYDDHAVYYKDGRKKYWLVKIEFHC